MASGRNQKELNTVRSAMAVYGRRGIPGALPPAPGPRRLPAGTRRASSAARAAWRGGTR
ncbi:hypothetical protein ATKI12_0246 [Kitasatospora sp. Ki12]